MNGCLKLGGAKRPLNVVLWVVLGMAEAGTTVTYLRLTTATHGVVRRYSVITDVSPAYILPSIQTAMAIMPRFSVKETKPSGTLEDPPTHAHLSSRLSR